MLGKQCACKEHSDRVAAPQTLVWRRKNHVLGSRVLFLGFSGHLHSSRSVSAFGGMVCF